MQKTSGSSASSLMLMACEISVCYRPSIWVLHCRAALSSMLAAVASCDCWRKPTRCFSNSTSSGTRNSWELCFRIGRRTEMFSVQAALNLYYPTENLKYTDGLGYYQQREWKIVPNFAHNKTWHFPPVVGDVRQELLDLSPEYFGKVMRNGKLRVDACAFFEKVGERWILGRAKRLIVPSDDGVRDQADALLKKYGFGIPVVKLGEH